MGAILHIKNFGPIKEAEIDVKEFLVLTGLQASGKSTIVKLIYYFMSIRQLVLNTQINAYHLSGKSLHEKVIFNMEKMFFQIFGKVLYDLC